MTYVGSVSVIIYIVTLGGDSLKNLVLSVLPIWRWHSFVSVLQALAQAKGIKIWTHMKSDSARKASLIMKFQLLISMILRTNTHRFQLWKCPLWLDAYCDSLCFTWIIAVIQVRLNLFWNIFLGSCLQTLLVLHVYTGTGWVHDIENTSHSYTKHTCNNLATSGAGAVAALAEDRKRMKYIHAWNQVTPSPQLPLRPQGGLDHWHYSF